MRINVHYYRQIDRQADTHTHTHTHARLRVRTNVDTPRRACVYKQVIKLRFGSGSETAIKTTTKQVYVVS